MLQFHPVDALKEAGFLPNPRGLAENSPRQKEDTLTFDFNADALRVVGPEGELTVPDFPVRVTFKKGWSFITNEYWVLESVKELAREDLKEIASLPGQFYSDIQALSRRLPKICPWLTDQDIADMCDKGII